MAKRAKRDQPPSTTFELPPQMTAAAPAISIMAVSGPSPSPEVEELRAQLQLRDEEIASPSPSPEVEELRAQLQLRDEEIARLRAELDARLAPTAAAEPGIGAGSPVSLVEYRNGRIYETSATVVAQLADHKLQVRARGSHAVIEVAPHDGSRPASESRVGWHGYQYGDPLQGPGLRTVI